MLKHIVNFFWPLASMLPCRVHVLSGYVNARCTCKQRRAP